MTTSRAQHASALTPRATAHPGRDLASGAGLAAVWAACWIFLALAVAAPAGRMHAASVRPDGVAASRIVARAG